MQRISAVILTALFIASAVSGFGYAASRTGPASSWEGQLDFTILDQHFFFSRALGMRAQEERSSRSRSGLADFSAGGGSSSTASGNSIFVINGDGSVELHVNQTNENSRQGAGIFTDSPGSGINQ